MEFISMEQITDLFKCKLCHKAYENPIILPCGDKICKNDLNQIYNQITLDDNSDIPHLKCPACHESITVPKNGFPVDREMKKLIEIGLDKLSFGEIFDNSKKEVHALREKIQALDKLKSEPKSYVVEYFNKLRSQLNASRTELKAKIDRSFEKLANEISANENECLEDLQSDKLDKARIDNELLASRECLQDFEERLNSLAVDEEEWTEISLKAKFLKYKLNDVITNLQAAYLQNTLFEIDSPELLDYPENFLGRLKTDQKRTTRNSDLEVYNFVSDNFQEFSYFKNAKVSSKDFQIEGFKWRLQMKNLNEDYLSCYLFCDLGDCKAVEATFQIELVNFVDQRDNEKLVGKARFSSNSNGYGKAQFITFNEIFEYGFYRQKSDSISINIYVQIDLIED